MIGAVGRNSLYNLVGFVVPLLLFVLTIPLYIHLIGAARYGVLAIVWLILGLSGFLDLGLGRAVMQKIAALGSQPVERRRAAVGTALAANLVVAAATSALVAGAGWLTFAHTMRLEPWLREEAVMLVPLLAVGAPLVTTIGVLNGALQGREKFALTNRVAITNAAAFQLLPLGLAWIFGPQLWILVVGALAGRGTALAMLLRECHREFGSDLLRSWDRNDLKSMLGFGGWVTATGIVGMALVFSDRFLVGSSIGAVAVTVYTIPQDATRRMAFISDSLSNALFPRLARASESHSRELMDKAIAVLFAISTPTLVAFLLLADPIMRIWLGHEIGTQTAPLARIFAIAAWVNIFAKPAYAKLQARGRPQIAAWIGMAEVIPYLIFLSVALAEFGLQAAALTYLIRNTVDAVALNLCAERRVAKGWLLSLGFAVLCFGAYALQELGPLDFAGLAMLGMIAIPLTLACSYLAIPKTMRNSLIELIRINWGQTGK